MYNDAVTRLQRSGKKSGRRSRSPLWRHQWRFFLMIFFHADDVKREMCIYFTVVGQEARVSIEHVIKMIYYTRPYKAPGNILICWAF